MVPIQPLTVFRIATACGLLTVHLPFSTIIPPPLEASHSSASHVRPSYALPCQTIPPNVGLLAFSPFMIVVACWASSSQVLGGALMLYFWRRSVRSYRIPQC